MRRASSGSALASVVVVAAAAAGATAVFSSRANAQVLFNDDFDVNHSGNYDVATANSASDASADFFKDYSTLQYQAVEDDAFVFKNVPPAPHTTGGTTRGAVFQVNDVSNAVNIISAYPKNQNFSGNYKLTFDMFIGYNGPATGGTASTEYSITGINIATATPMGAAGPDINGTIKATSSGNTFGVNGERGNNGTNPGQDYRTWIDQTNQGARGFAAPNTVVPPATGTNQQSGRDNAYYNNPTTGLFPAPEFETSGAPGKHWVTVEISQIAGVITWKIDNWSTTNRQNKIIASYPDRTRTSGNITLGYADLVTSSAPAGQAQYQFVVYDNVVVEAMPVSLYWDVDGAGTAGAGGATPTGNWDGTALNFNTDAAGANAGVVTPFTSANEDVNFAAGADGTGAYAVTVTGAQTAKSLNIARGNVTLAGAGSIGTPTINVAAGATAAISATLAGGPVGGSLTKTGPGTLTVSSANTYAGGTTVSAGTLVLGNADATAGGAINVANGALAQAQAGLTKAVTVTTLATNASGKFDLTNNSMVVKGMADSAVRTLLQAGYNAGAWNGPTGITSSSVTPAAATSVGYATKTQLGVTSFKGVTGLAATDVLVKFTYAGDANLDGKVDIGDLGLLAGAWQQASGKVWFDGDFTYDGAVDIGDLGLLSGNWQKGTDGNPNPPLMDFSTAMAQFSAFDGVVLPEPSAAAALAAVAGVASLGRRRRQSRAV